MDRIRRISVRLHEFRFGQTKTDFAMIVLAFAVVVYVGYETIGKRH
jgi:hypothetical protein